MYKRGVEYEWLGCPQSKRGKRRIPNRQLWTQFLSRQNRIDTCPAPSNANHGNHLSLLTPFVA